MDSKERLPFAHGGTDKVQQRREIQRDSLRGERGELKTAIKSRNYDESFEERLGVK
jgi:hypothetical protein